MASFPTAVKSFVSRNAGDVIQPAHINDLQDEVNAVEAGYLNGTANLNSSNSTVANLSVTGGCTLASTITIGGVSYQFPSAAPASSGAALIVQSTGTPNVLKWGTAVGLSLLATNSSEGTTASSGGYTACSSVSGLSVDSNTTLIVEYVARCSGAVAGGGIQVTVNGASTTTIHKNSLSSLALGGINCPFSNANASQGWFHLELGPRTASYDRSVNGYATVVDSTGAATVPAIIMGHGASTFTGTVTSVEVLAHSEGGVTIGVSKLRVYSKAGV